ncbi:Basic 7S globulin [Nymphaea thermarum]|nr:Basic 7S globulin [Nymphaea thermarum]
MAQFQAAIFFLSLTVLCILAASAPPSTSAVMAPIKLDQRTSLYTFSANGGSSFVIDLSSQVLSLNCPGNHPTFPCKSLQCSAVTGSSFSPSCQPPHFTRCSSGACTIPLQNSVGNSCVTAELTQTTLNLNTTNGHNPTGPISIPHLLSACVPPAFLVPLPYHAQGVAPFGLTKFSLPSLLASAAPGLKQKFALCLPSTENAPGVLFFGEGPFFLLPPWNSAVTSSLSYTQLVRHPEHPLDYLIPLKGIAVAQKGIGAPVPSGIARLSTTVPYSTLSTPVYKAFTSAFNEATSGIPRVTAVKPFEICLNSSNLGGTRVGAPVGPVDLMLDGKNWTMFGANLMKEIDDSRLCLAFLDGGYRPRYEFVIGSFQMQDNFLLFDLENRRLGFSSSLLFFQTTCANFNFTSSVA